MIRKTVSLCLLIVMMVLITSGCGAKLYTEDELNELHDVVGYVQDSQRAYTNVILKSLPSVIAQSDPYDYDLLDFLTTRGYDMDKPFVCITYDDGPNPEVTPKLLDLLEQYGGKATFFMVGDNLYDSNQEIVQRMVALGCQVGNHTTDHPQLSALTQEEARSAMVDNGERIKELAGVECRVLRPPYGDYSEETSAVATNPFILWSVDSLDWKSRNADSVYNIVTDEVYDGAIILMHDLYDSTYEASARIIPWLAENGYQMVTISEMAYIRGVQLQNGYGYYDFNAADYQ